MRHQTLTVVALALAACGGTPPGEGSMDVRDSAGVQIVTLAAWFSARNRMA